MVFVERRLNVKAVRRFQKVDPWINTPVGHNNVWKYSCVVT